MFSSCALPLYQDSRAKLLPSLYMFYAVIWHHCGELIISFSVFSFGVARDSSVTLKYKRFLLCILGCTRLGFGVLCIFDRFADIEIAKQCNFSILHLCN